MPNTKLIAILLVDGQRPQGRTRMKRNSAVYAKQWPRPSFRAQGHHGLTDGNEPSNLQLVDTGLIAP